MDVVAMLPLYEDPRFTFRFSDDRIIARGGGSDRVSCGSGTDIAYVDSSDKVSGCEQVR